MENLNNCRLLIKEYMKDGKKCVSLYILDTEKGDKIPINLYTKTPKEFGYKINRLIEMVGKDV